MPLKTLSLSNSESSPFNTTNNVVTPSVLPATCVHISCKLLRFLVLSPCDWWMQSQTYFLQNKPNSFLQWIIHALIRVRLWLWYCLGMIKVKGEDEPLPMLTYSHGEGDALELAVEPSQYSWHHLHVKPFHSRPPLHINTLYILWHSSSKFLTSFLNLLTAACSQKPCMRLTKRW